MVLCLQRQTVAKESQHVKWVRSKWVWTLCQKTKVSMNALNIELKTLLPILSNNYVKTLCFEESVSKLNIFFRHMQNSSDLKGSPHVKTVPRFQRHQFPDVWVWGWLILSSQSTPKPKTLDLSRKAILVLKTFKGIILSFLNLCP